MRLKVIYTGDPSETKILNAETGEHLMGISSAEISIGPYEAYCALVLQDFELEADNLRGELFSPPCPTASDTPKG
tara:strand:- start:503 stop:727 length:225 start_codon:yes stop_codon:yes gene_type:complete